MTSGPAAFLQTRQLFSIAQVFLDGHDVFQNHGHTFGREKCKAITLPLLALFLPPLML